MLRPPAQVDQARRAVARAADGVDHREIVGEKARAFRHLDARVEGVGKLARRGLELGGTEIVGRRVDEVAAEIERLGERQNPVLARAVGEDEPLGLAVIGRLVAGEAVAPGEETERGQLRVRKRRGEAIIAFGQRIGENPRQQRNLRRPILAAGAKQDTADAALLHRAAAAPNLACRSSLAPRPKPAQPRSRLRARGRRRRR